MFRRARNLLSQNNGDIIYRRSVKLKHQWITPKGYDTGIKVYSRLVRDNVPLIILNRNFLKWYICGPTVYDVSHIGHGSVFVRNDILNRIFQHFFHINPIIGLSITDIDDKIIKQSKKLKVDWKSLARSLELEFCEQLRELNVLPPSFMMRVTEHIPEIIEFISRIMDKGKCYAVEGGSVYYEKSSEDIWKLVTPQEPIPSALNSGQKSSTDFALWKGSKPEEPSWKSPWGDGRPGWHIECSAMASKVFGSELDIHSGGIDLLFPHHENEEVQSCCYHGRNQWVNYWMHTGEVFIEGKKMSKSLGNYVTLSDFLKSYTADDFRMYCFMTKYRHALHYSSSCMELPVISCKIISRFLADTNSYVKGNWTKGNFSEAELLQELEETNTEVMEHLKNDFNTGKCYVSLMNLIRNTVRKLNEDPDSVFSRSPGAVAAVAQYINETFKGFGFQLRAANFTAQSGDYHKLEFTIDQAVKFRSQVREEALSLTDKSAKKNILKFCDLFRDELKTVGIDIKDLQQNNSSWSLRHDKKLNKETEAESAG